MAAPDPAPPSNSASRSSVAPSTSKRFWRLVGPETNSTADRRTPNARARATATASVARPSAAGSDTRTTRAPPCSPPTAGRRDPGCTWTVTRTLHPFHYAKSPGNPGLSLCCGGRYWDRTSDLFRVREARYRCANRPWLFSYVKVRPSELETLRTTFPRWRRDSNPCTRLCRPLPRLSATPPCVRTNQNPQVLLLLTPSG